MNGCHREHTCGFTQFNGESSPQVQNNEGKVSTSAAVRTHTMHPLTESEIRSGMSLSEPVLKPCSGLHGVYVTGTRHCTCTGGVSLRGDSCLPERQLVERHM